MDAFFIDTTGDSNIDIGYTPGPTPRQIAGVDNSGNPVANAGTIIINADGSYTFTPVMGFLGTVEAAYRICNDTSDIDTCDLGTFRIDVGTTTTLIPHDDANYLESGGQQTGNLLINDWDPQGDTFSVTEFNELSEALVPAGTTINTTNGRITINSDGSFVYNSNADWIGTEVFPYTICNDANQRCRRATLYLTSVSRLLPITLIEFNGELVNKKTVELTWSTASETDNDYFEIERRYESESEFRVIGTRQGAGNSDIRNDYSFTDFNVNADRIFYRVKQVDFDGNFSYTHIIVLDNKSIDDSLFVFTNPNSIVVEIKTMGDKFAKDIQVYSTNGAMIDFVDLNGENQSHTQQYLDSSQYSKGVVIILVTFNDGSRKVVKTINH